MKRKLGFSADAEPDLKWVERSAGELVQRGDSITSSAIIPLGEPDQPLRFTMRFSDGWVPPPQHMEKVWPWDGTAYVDLDHVDGGLIRARYRAVR